MDDKQAELYSRYYKLMGNVEDFLTTGFAAQRHELDFTTVESPQEIAARKQKELEAQKGPGEVDYEPVFDASMQAIVDEVAVCKKCDLYLTRTNTVPGMGNPHADLMIIGEGPGGDEDKQGLPFVGAAGQYLDKWISAIGLTRMEHCYIANIVKCRPPANRDPSGVESKACLPYLYRQIEVVKPKVIMTLGRIASKILLNTETGITVLRGKVHRYKNIPVVPTYHPAAVLRNMDFLRRPVWEDLQRLKQVLEDNTDWYKAP